MPEQVCYIEEEADAAGEDEAYISRPMKPRSGTDVKESVGLNSKVKP